MKVREIMLKCFIKGACSIVIPVRGDSEMIQECRDSSQGEAKAEEGGEPHRVAVEHFVLIVVRKET